MTLLFAYRLGDRCSLFASEMVVYYFISADGEAATFRGQGHITYDISGPNQWVQTRHDYIRLRFKTNTADGLLVFADGNQGDYIILEMVRGRMFLNLDLGQLVTRFIDFIAFLMGRGK